MDKSDKKHTVCFYGDCSILNPLKDKFNEISVNIGDDFKSSKYCFIIQNNFERLSNLELSEIIDHDTIIVSVLTEEQLKSNNFIKNLQLIKYYKNSNYLILV